MALNSKLDTRELVTLSSLSKIIDADKRMLDPFALGSLDCERQWPTRNERIQMDPQF